MRSNVRSVSLARFLLFIVILMSAGRPGDARDLWKRYDATVIDAATYNAENLRPLFPLTFDNTTKTATVVTLTTYDYPTGQQPLKRDVWVTAVPEVQTKCEAFQDRDLELRLKQLLGLQPDKDKKIRYFVTIQVRADDIFRPTTNPITTTKWPCGDKKEDYCGEIFPEGTRDDFKAWIARQMLTSYVVSPTHNGSYSYPWTRLGYTYDWKYGAGKRRYGASEYVIRQGAVVVVVNKTPIADYCGRNGDGQKQ